MGTMVGAAAVVRRRVVFAVVRHATDYFHFATSYCRLLSPPEPSPPAEGIRDMPPNGTKRHDEKAGHAVGKSRSIAISTAGVDRTSRWLWPDPHVFIQALASLPCDDLHCRSALSVDTKVKVLLGGKFVQGGGPQVRLHNGCVPSRLLQMFFHAVLKVS